MKTLGVCLAASFLFYGLAIAQETENAEAPKAEGGPCSADIHRQFDFWVGDWEVRDAEGVLQGTNFISLEEQGCLLVERWTSTSGSTGQSYNYVDLETDLWRQVWVSGGMTIDYSGGLTETGVMRLEGTIAYRGGQTASFMGEWTPNEDGSVRQHFEQLDAESGEWTPWFTGIYTRIESDE